MALRAYGKGPEVEQKQTFWPVSRRRWELRGIVFTVKLAYGS